MDFHDAQDLTKALTRAANALEGIEEKLDRLERLEKHVSGLEAEFGRFARSYDFTNNIIRTDE
jgi:hypothetical protein